MNGTLTKSFSQRRGRSPEGNWELYSWLFMRVSGVLLLGLAVFHLFWMHIAIGVENIDFMTVVGRWANPFWKIYDFFLLLFALTHGMNGLRVIMDDYVRRPGWRVFWKSFGFIVYVAFLGIGAYIILTFTPEMWMDVSEAMS